MVMITEVTPSCQYEFHSGVLPDSQVSPSIRFTRSHGFQSVGSVTTGLVISTACITQLTSQPGVHLRSKPSLVADVLPQAVQTKILLDSGTASPNIIFAICSATFARALLTTFCRCQDRRYAQWHRQSANSGCICSVHTRRHWLSCRQGRWRRLDSCLCATLHARKDALEGGWALWMPQPPSASRSCATRRRQ